jgi:hypothetical protein
MLKSGSESGDGKATVCQRSENEEKKAEIYLYRNLKIKTEIMEQIKFMRLRRKWMEIVQSRQKSGRD